MFAIPGSRKGYYQWDLNQKLYIQDSSCNEVHFCSERHPEALTCLVQEELGKRYVQVPNILLQSCLPITAFYYVKGETVAYTKRSFCIEVWERPKPDDYVYTETEVKTWESAVEYALQEAKESGVFKGEKGEKGEKGDKGDTGEQGPQGEKGDGFLTEGDKLELSICCDAEGQLLSLKDASDLPLMGLRIFGKTTQDGTPTKDVPVDLVSVGNGGSITVTVCGKNLLQPTAASSTVSGVTFTVNADGSVIADGTATSQIWFHVGTLNLTVGAKYRLTGGASGGANRTYKLYYKYDEAKYADDYGGGVEFTPTENYATQDVVICITSGITVTNLVFYPMVHLASNSDDSYEPYKGSSVTPLIPDGLPGIPVSSGGNYTDANGQQWLAHIAGYVQDGQIGEWVTTGHIESYAGEAIPGVYLSSTGGLDAGATVQYALEVPVFEPYSADLQEQWRALQTNKPNTTIYNDTGAWMQVSYAADTKSYIDNKFAELAAAIVNNT